MNELLYRKRIVVFASFVVMAHMSRAHWRRDSPTTRSLWEPRGAIRPLDSPSDVAFEFDEVACDINDSTDPRALAIAETLRERAHHGTTTVALCFDGGIACAVDSRASMGSYVGSSTTEKVIPFSPYVLGTMAGSAADCSYFIRLVSARAKLYELENGERLTAAAAASILASMLRRQPRALGLSVGTMIMGVDCGKPQLCYVDSDGSCIKGKLFAVGSGSPFAYSVLDAHYRPDLDAQQALDLVEKAVTTAAYRDAYSGGILNVYFIDKATGLWSRVKRIET